MKECEYAVDWEFNEKLLTNLKKCTNNGECRYQVPFAVDEKYCVMTEISRKEELLRLE